ncbi:MAG: O-antigen ligase family protein [Allorhizobium sp.]
MTLTRLPALEGNRPMVLFGGLLWLLAMSATLVETDAYRYAAIALVMSALLMPPVGIKRSADWLTWLCVGWAVYVGVRFLVIYAMTATHDRGSSEFLYIFPAFFPLLGLALWRYRANIEGALAVFFAVALLALLLTTQYGVVISGERASPLVHKNPIHGAAGAGLVMIGAFYWFMFYFERGLWRTQLSKFATISAPLIFALCVFNVYGAKSKGVWLAMSMVLPFMCLSVLFYMNRKTGMTLTALVAAVIMFGCYNVRDNLWQTAGPTIEASSSIATNEIVGGRVESLLDQTIRSDETPIAMKERLKLWSNAMEIIEQAPVFGVGNSWLRLWEKTRYSDVGYDLIHNGYLEIVIRHGLFGLLVCAVILCALVYRSYKALSHALISKSAFFCYLAMIAFFLIALLSNSDNRLAIGESFFLMIGAVAFYCTERLARDMPASHA